MKAKIAVASLVLAAACAWPQAAAHRAVKPERPGLPKDPAALVQAIRMSSYHPDGLTLIECDAAVDWAAQAKNTSLIKPDEMRALKGLHIHVRSVRSQPAMVSFDWQNGGVAEQEIVEKQLRETLTGFYKMYWSMIAVPMLTASDQPEHVTNLPDGGAKLWGGPQGAQAELVVNAEGTITHFSFSGGSVKVAVDLGYAASAHPSPGDLRRVSRLMLDTEFGASSVKQEWTLEYQEVNGFGIPKAFTVGLVGMPSTRFELTACKAATFAVSQ